MSKTISIDITKNEFGDTRFNVSMGERSSGELTFEEMLGIIAALAMPEPRPCVHWMMTQAEHSTLFEIYEPSENDRSDQ